MINRSLTALGTVVKALAENQRRMGAVGPPGRRAASNGGLKRVPYRHSKLTRVLRDAFGGNCSTTLLLTASPSSYNISETLATLRFGQRCRRVRNTPRVNVDLSPNVYRGELLASERKQKELMNFVKALAGECRALKEEGMRDRLPEGSHSGPLWDSIDTILEDEGGPDTPHRRITGAATLHGGRTSRKPQRARSEGAERGENADEFSDLQNQLSDAQGELESLQNELKSVTESRDAAESRLAEIQSEAAVLRTQNEQLDSDKKRNMQDLIDAKNEVQVLSQRKLEVEHNLRTSQFRENEATVFLRQFRRFYRRLLRNKAAQGTGDTTEITAKVPGVPDLNDLIDVDTLLLESGLIEEEELHDDTSVATYRPSSQALVRSTAAAKKASREASALERALSGDLNTTDTNNDNDGNASILTSSSLSSRRPMGTVGVGEHAAMETISEIGDGGASELAQSTSRDGSDLPTRRGADDITSIGERGERDPNQPPNSEVGGGADAGAGSAPEGMDLEEAKSLTENVAAQSITSRGPGSSESLTAIAITRKQKLLRTPSGRLTTLRERDLERDLLQMTERCIELQIALNEEKANVDVLTNRAGNNKKRLTQETVLLRQALDRKTHDLQAIIWKMNELHLINKTYNEKMANREQHVTYLEENLVDLQATNRRLVAERQESEKKLRDELENLKVLVDAMTIPLWQFGEVAGSAGGRNLACRMMVPVRGGERPDVEEEDWDDDPALLGHHGDDDLGDADSYASQSLNSAAEDASESIVGKPKSPPKPTMVDEATQTEVSDMDRLRTMSGTHKLSSTTAPKPNEGGEHPRIVTTRPVIQQKLSFARRRGSAGGGPTGINLNVAIDGAGDDVSELAAPSLVMERDDRNMSQPTIDGAGTGLTPIEIVATNGLTPNEASQQQKGVPQEVMRQNGGVERPSGPGAVPTTVVADMRGISARSTLTEKPIGVEKPDGWGDTNQGGAAVPNSSTQKAQHSEGDDNEPNVPTREVEFEKQPLKSETDDYNNTSVGMFPGGKSSLYRPRRFTRKLGPAIKPGVLKESKKSRTGSVASGGSSSRRVGSTVGSSSTGRRRDGRMRDGGGSTGRSRK